MYVVYTYSTKSCVDVLEISITRCYGFPTDIIVVIQTYEIRFMYGIVCELLRGFFIYDSNPGSNSFYGSVLICGLTEQRPFNQNLRGIGIYRSHFASFHVLLEIRRLLIMPLMKSSLQVSLEVS